MSDLDVTLADGTGDEDTSRGCGRRSIIVLDRHRPDFVFYLAGADPFEGDRLGRLSLTIDGLARATGWSPGAAAASRSPRAWAAVTAVTSMRLSQSTSTPSGRSAVPLLLTEADVRSVLPMSDLIAAMESALAEFSAGACSSRCDRADVGAAHAFFGVMPAFVPSPARLAPSW